MLLLFLWESWLHDQNAKLPRGQTSDRPPWQYYHDCEHFYAITLKILSICHALTYFTWGKWTIWLSANLWHGKGKRLWQQTILQHQSVETGVFFVCTHLFVGMSCKVYVRVSGVVGGNECSNDLKENNDPPREFSGLRVGGFSPTFRKQIFLWHEGGTAWFVARQQSIPRSRFAINRLLSR